MHKLKYPKTNSTAKIGVDFIRSIVNYNNCIFHEINANNDLGIDAMIEIIKDEKPTGKLIATQIKSGKSYFNKKKNLCKLPVKNHSEYWTNYHLPVYGIVYVPEYGDAYWVNIKNYLKHNPKDTTIYFERTIANRLNKKTFLPIFVQRLSNEAPDISFKLAKTLFASDKLDEVYLGLYALHKKYAGRNESWQLIIDYFKTKDIEDIPRILIYILAHIPGHPDIAYYKDTLTKEAREFGKTQISTFGKEQILKLLAFVDEENRIARGTLGQSVEAIVSFIPNFEKFLEEIIKDNKIEIHLREVASIIYAYHKGKDSIELLKTIPQEESRYIPELIKHLIKYEYLDLYG